MSRATATSSPNPARRRKGITSHSFGDKLLLSDDHRNRVHVLNAGMAVVWELCDGRHSAEQIAGGLAQRFECSPDDDLDAATDAALAELTSLELLAGP